LRSRLERMVSPEGEPSRAPRVALSGGTSRNEHKQQMSSAPPPPGEGGAFSLTPDSSCKRPDPPRRDGSGAGHNALRAVLGSCPGLHLHLAAGVCMSITTYLDDFDADLETKTVLGGRARKGSCIPWP